MLNTVKKVGPVLALFTPERPEWRMSDIAKALDMPKSSTHSLVCTLADIGLLSTTNNGRYRLGWMLITLGERMRASMSFSSLAVPVMLELSAALRETVLLAVLDRDEVLYLERVEGTHPTVRLAGVRVGARLPAHCTSVGKVLLADRDPAEVRAMIARTGMRQLTKRSLSSLDALEYELEKVRARGYAVDRGEVVPDICCQAVPVLDREGAVIAAMCVGVPKYRFDATRETVLGKLVEAGETISARLVQSELNPERDLPATDPVSDPVAAQLPGSRGRDHPRSNGVPSARRPAAPRATAGV